MPDLTIKRLADDDVVDPALPTCTCEHTAGSHYPRNITEDSQGVKPCWVCGCTDYAAAHTPHRHDAVLAWLIEQYGAQVAQRRADWERDAVSLLDVIDASAT